MKQYSVILLSFVLNVSFAQKASEIKKLEDGLKKIYYWAVQKNFTSDTSVSPPDSIEKYNGLFEAMLVKDLSSDANTIQYNFGRLDSLGFVTVSSEDGLFRIYTWDTETGGTMRIFESVFQYKANGKVFVKAANTWQNGDAGCDYYQINDITSGSRQFYFTQSAAVLSHRLSYQNIKFFSIDNEVLNDTVKLIKTRSGVKNELGYEVDLFSASNIGGEMPDYSIVYDKENKVISIPVILDDGQITAKRIRYRFNGKYFEKL